MEMKGTVVLLGSPRKAGNSETLAEAFLKGAGERAGQITRFRLSEMSPLSGCLDCRQCWTQGKPCVLKDPMREIHDALRVSDLIIFVSPLYWYTWSGQIKPVLDRFLPFVSETPLFDLRGKKAILISTAGDSDPKCFDGLRFSFRSSCALLGLENLHEILAHGIYRRGEIEGTEWLEQAERFGNKIL
jgi:multimeric flavodoxin WrbA